MTRGPQISGRMVTAKIRYEEGSYTGEVNDSKVPNGEGTFEYRGDDEDGRLMYDGGWKDKAAHGYGVMKWQNGDRYEGDWSEGQRHGQGSYTWKEKNENTEEIEENTYTGTWEMGKKHGDGKFTYHGGDVFTGPYVDGNRHGNGELVKTDGEVRAEVYKEGKLINFTVTKEKKA